MTADPHPRPVSRRRFLERSAMAVAGGVLFSCTGGKVVPRVSPSSTRAVRRDTRWPVKHVIYLMLENRSFDNLFGRFPGVNGARVGNMLGQEKPLLRCPDWLPGDLPTTGPRRSGSITAGATTTSASPTTAIRSRTRSSSVRRSPPTGSGRVSSRSATTSSRRCSVRRCRTTTSSSPASRAEPSTTRRTSRAIRPRPRPGSPAAGTSRAGDATRRPSPASRSTWSPSTRRATRRTAGSVSTSRRSAGS